MLKSVLRKSFFEKPLLDSESAQGSCILIGWTIGARVVDKVFNTQYGEKAEAASIS